jgi:hypothetical protein
MRLMFRCCSFFSFVGIEPSQQPSLHENDDLDVFEICRFSSPIGLEKPHSRPLGNGGVRLSSSDLQQGANLAVFVACSH